MITPIGFMSPPLSFSATSGLASSAAATIGRARRRRRSRPGPRPRRSPAGRRRRRRACRAPARRRAGDLLVAHEPTSCASAAGATLESAGSLVAERATSSLVIQLASGWALGARRGRQRGLEVVAELGAEGEQLRARRRCRPSSRSKRSARAAGSSGSAARARVEHRLGDRDRRRGRARGSSGSRAPPPWSAAT